MRTVHNKYPIPKRFAKFRNYGKLILHEFDTFPKRRGKLAAKTLIFPAYREMDKFWRIVLGNSPGKGCLGIVTQLKTDHEWFDKQGAVHRWQTVDPVYFCVVGLLREHLSCEIVAHESVHVGFAYAERVNRRVFSKPDDLAEEEVAYPAGRYVASAIQYFRQKGLWQ